MLYFPFLLVNICAVPLVGNTFFFRTLKVLFKKKNAIKKDKHTGMGTKGEWDEGQQ